VAWAAELACTVLYFSHTHTCPGTNFAQVSLDYDDLGRESEKYFGKLRANFVGTEFTIFDDGIKANKKVGEVGGEEDMAT
jgi:hypothetical protein